MLREIDHKIVLIIEVNNQCSRLQNLFKIK